MLSRPTRSMLRALIELSRAANWKEIDSLLRLELEWTTDKLIQVSDEVAVRKLQGRAQMIKDFRALVESAPDDLSKTPA